MAPAEEHYRRLPGRRRGLITGASVWMGSDHILLVKSSWFREEYKRFYLRDIQAIAVAPGPRFYFSIPMLALAMAWPIPAFFLEQWPRPVTIGWIAATIALAAAWLAVSLAGGCRCRLYTAVSRDELPSLFRTWTARRFLRQLEPRIAEVQGVLDPSWAESEAAAPAGAEAAAAAAAPSTARPRPAAGHTPVSDLFVLALAGSAITGLVTAHSRSVGWDRANTALSLLVIVAAVAVLVQYSRGIVGRGLQRVAVAAMLVSGATFYIQSFTFIYARGAAMAAQSNPTSIPAGVIVAHQVTYAMQLLLSLAGGILTLRATYSDEPDIIKD